MNEAETTIRESLLNTLSFFASEIKQQEFAAKVFYATYHDEFACWWFDTFYPEELSTLNMFSPSQLAVLKTFSETLDQELGALGDGPLTIEQLQSRPEWKAVVANARAACSVFKNAT